MKPYVLSSLPLLIAVFGLSSELSAAPLNDAFANAAVVTGFPISVTGSNEGATLEPGEPSPQALGDEGASVWYSWTATSSGLVQIDTRSSDFDDILAVWTGSQLASLVEIGSHNGSDFDPTSAVVFDAIAGTTYHIAVYGNGGHTGSIDLHIRVGPQSQITGTGTGPDGSTPLEGIRVTAHYWNWFNENWPTAATTMTAADGSYTLDNLLGRNYRVRFVDESKAHIDEYYDDVTSSLSATEVVVADSTTVTGIDASLTAVARISGTVTASDGITPVEYVVVAAFLWYPEAEVWDLVERGRTFSDGSYFLGELEPGTYRLRFDPDDNQHVSEYYNNASTLDSATDIVMAGPVHVSGINASLPEGARITGTITASDGITPLESARVTVTGDGKGGQTFSAADGSYSVGGLGAGTYRLEVFPPSGSDYLSEYYDNADTWASATAITVATMETVSGIDVSLTGASHITGTVSASDGTSPLAGVRVYVDEWLPEYSQWVGLDRYFVTTADGSYSVDGLKGASYRLRFRPVDGRYLSEYYDDADTFDAASDIVVASSTTVAGIDASLAEASHITGTVTAANGRVPLYDADVYAYRWDPVELGWRQWSTSTASDGSYSLSGLAAGTYRVRFSPDFNDPGHLTEYYENAGTLESATDIVLPASSTVSGINASLPQKGAHITGTVTAPDGSNPFGQSGALAYRWDPVDLEWDFEGFGSSVSDGSYYIGGLEPGTYRVEFRAKYPNSNEVLTEFYDDVDTLEAAADIVVAEGALITGIDASLGIALPKLTIRQSGANVVISWPIDETGWNLQSSPHLNISESWFPVPQSVVDTATEHTVTVPRAGIARIFFRLSR